MCFDLPYINDHSCGLYIWRSHPSTYSLASLGWHLTITSSASVSFLSTFHVHIPPQTHLFPMAAISFEELHRYHKLDRDIFSRLVIKFRRDRAESLLVMAVWLWLEEKGYPNILVKMVGLPDAIVNALANEAVLCLNCLESDNPRVSPSGGIPITARLMGRDISLQMFNQNRFTAISGIKCLLNNVCCQIFTDILQIVLPGTSRVNPYQPIVVPGFPHPVFGAINIVPTAMGPVFPMAGLWDWQPTDDVSEEDRTMFLTFSRGFPVLEDEVKELYTGLYGDCVESVEMAETSPDGDQPLYAKMVLRSVSFVDRILDGRRIAKFRTNGKHIWARKYARRE